LLRGIGHLDRCAACGLWWFVVVVVCHAAAHRCRAWSC
jgi:hypothetical protein